MGYLNWSSIKKQKTTTIPSLRSLFSSFPINPISDYLDTKRTKYHQDILHFDQIKVLQEEAIKKAGESLNDKIKQMIDREEREIKVPIKNQKVAEYLITLYHLTNAHVLNGNIIIEMH